MLLKPFTQLRTMAKLEKVGNFHLYLLFDHERPLEVL
jgi:hypothetical protein